ncbi:MAG: transketolase, partial [Chloroflexi bacterium]|nr:transketolase [Chloroflexota bacterium]
MSEAELDALCVNTMRFLAVDAVEKANSGHPGTPMGAAPMAYVLWDRFLRYNPKDPQWPDRDRFILSPGHASLLLYSLLHLTGYDLPLEQIQQFRQWQSKAPGHPELGETPGVEMTTGPLGQGFASGVGMAIGERWLADHYNRPGHELFNHHTYAIVSDGDLQEGVASEAASLAGTLKLDKLIYLYDDNDISIEGNTNIAFAENVDQRFQAYGWHVIGPIDGMDLPSVDLSIRMAQLETVRPSLIICRTIIGYGSPNKQGTAAAHGEALGEEEVRLTKERLGWPTEEPFTIPHEALAHFRKGLASKEGQPTDAETAALFFGLACAQAATIERHQIVQEVVANMTSAFDYYEKVGDVVRAVGIAGSPVLWIGSESRSGLEGLIDRALELIPPDSIEAGHLLARQGEVLGQEEGDYVGAQEFFERALAIARRERDVALEMETLA